MRVRTGLFAAALFWSGGATPTASETSSVAERDRATLVLDRATFGARPGDLDALLEQGVEKWLDAQLDPDALDDEVVAAKLSSLESLSADTSELMKRYPRPSRAEREAMQKARDEGRVSQAERRARQLDSPAKVLRELSEAKLVRAVHSDRQLLEVMTDFWFNHFNVYARKNRNTLLALPSYERDAIRAHALGRFEDLLVATAQHPAMLFYLDNWINTKEGFDPREAMRSRMNGGGRNRRSRDDASREDSREFGLNENYARELMELHTLGVDGGYDQDDVVEVARAFTGWSVVGPGVTRVRERFRGARGGERGRRGGRPGAFLNELPEEGSFFFNELAHDTGTKHVLDASIDAGGLNDGLEVLSMLSRHPSTATFVSTKLAQKFVSDTPSDAMVGELADTFTRTGGDIASVLRTLFLSERFVTEGVSSGKVKTPLELIASAARATGAEVVGPGLARATQDLGMPLYMCQPPTGYDEGAETWLSPGSLLARAEFATRFASGRLPGMRLKPGVSDEASLALQLAGPEFQKQ